MTMATVAYKRRLFPVQFLKQRPMARSPRRSRCTHWFALVRALLFCTAFVKTRKLPVYRQYTGSCRGRGAHSHPLPATSSLGAATPPVRTLRRRDNKNIFKKCLDFAWTLLTRAAAAGVPKLLLDGLAAQKRFDAKVISDVHANELWRDTL